MVLVIALVLFCVLLFRFAIYALPAAVGLNVGYWAITTGAGVIGGIFAGAATGIAVFAIGQIAFTSSRSSVTRVIVGLVFVIPAVWAGYSMVLQLAEVSGTTSSLWQHVFAVTGSLVIGYIAFSRLVGPRDDTPQSFMEPETPVTRLTAHSVDARGSRKWSPRA